MSRHGLALLEVYYYQFNISNMILADKYHLHPHFFQVIEYMHDKVPQGIA